MAEQLIQKNPISPRSTSPAIPDHQLKPIRHQKLSKVNQIWTWVGFFNRNNISQNNEEFVGAIVLGRTDVTIYWISTTSPRTELQRPPEAQFPHKSKLSMNRKAAMKSKILNISKKMAF